MTMPDTLPRAARPFVEFSTLLRANGFAVAPDQTQTFIQAVGLLGPRSMADIHRAALATLAPRARTPGRVRRAVPHAFPRPDAGRARGR